MSTCEQSTEKNRAEFPAAAAALAEWRAEFGAGVKLLYAVENGKSIGKKPVAPKQFTTPDNWLKASDLINEELERRALKLMFDSGGKLMKGKRS